MSCKLTIGSQDGVGGTIGLLAEKTGYSGIYTQNGLRFGDHFGHYIEAWVFSGSLRHIMPPNAGIACYVSKADNKMELILRGLPTKKPTTGSAGTIYVENGILKMYTGNF